MTAKPSDFARPVVTMETSMGTIAMELYFDVVPATVNNFLGYTHADLYAGTVFHRVIANFVIQAGGYLRTSAGYSYVPTAAPIALESNTGLSNLRGTVAMARTNQPDSATSQFYINTVDNSSGLDYKNASEPGYAVFGRVINGIKVVDKISNVKVANTVPVTDVIVLAARSTQFIEGKRADFTLIHNGDDSFSVVPLGGNTEAHPLKFIDRLEFTDRSVSLGSAYAGIHKTQDMILLAKASGSALSGDSGNDWLIGKEGGDTLTGGAGNDTLEGGSGTDTLDGGKGNDIYIVDHPEDLIRELARAGVDTVRLTSAASGATDFDFYTLPSTVENLVLDDGEHRPSVNVVYGHLLANSITGNSVDNVIDGKGGKDTLTGGGGNDIFQFTTAPGGVKNALIISDFDSASDQISLSSSIYSAFAGSTEIATTRFVAATMPIARSATENLLYYSASGRLYYDADGSGKKAPVMMAILTGVPDLTASDFLIIG